MYLCSIQTGKDPFLALLLPVVDANTESLRWLKGVGFVLEERSFAGKRRQRLIEQERIEDILISEVTIPALSRVSVVRRCTLVQALTTIDVHFYLVFVLKGENDFTVAFKVRSFFHILDPV